MIRFTLAEINAMERDVAGIEAAMDHHERQILQAESMGGLDACVDYHTSRKEQLKQERDRIVAAY